MDKRNHLQTYDDVTKNTIGQEDCSKEIYKLSAKYLSNQQALGADPKPMQQLIFLKI